MKFHAYFFFLPIIYDPFSALENRNCLLRNVARDVLSLGNELADEGRTDVFVLGVGFKENGLYPAVFKIEIRLLLLIREVIFVTNALYDDVDPRIRCLFKNHTVIRYDNCIVYIHRCRANRFKSFFKREKRFFIRIFKNSDNQHGAHIRRSSDYVEMTLCHGVKGACRKRNTVFHHSAAFGER